MGSSLDQYVEQSRRERDSLVTRVKQEEELALRDPSRTRSRVQLYVAIGYAFVIGLIVLLLLLLAGSVALMVYSGRISGGLIKFAFFTLVAVWILFRSIWITIPAPEGVELETKDAPELFRQVKELAVKTGSPDPEHILIIPEVNAAAVEVPRFGLLGAYRNYLLLGLPLLLTTTKEETLSIIAHEFGHFSGRHGKFGVKAYRQFQTWQFIATRLGEGGGSFLVRGFLNWFLPRFYAVTFGLRRQNEYDADATAARLYGADTFASALVRIGVAGDHLDREFWTPISERIKTDAHPPANWLSGIVTSAKRPVDSEAAIAIVRSSLLSPDDYSDSHPVLKDRLAAIGAPSDDAVSLLTKLPPVTQSAAEAFLGPALDSMVQRVEEAQAAVVQAGWEEAHAAHQEFVKRETELAKMADEEPPSPETEFERGAVAYQLHGAEAAEAILRPAHTAFPENNRILFMLGFVLLQQKKEEGVELIEYCMKVEEASRTQGLQALFEYYQSCHAYDKLADLKERAFSAEAADEFALQEATRIRLSDNMVALREPAIAEALVAQFVLRKDVDQVYLVSKTIPDLENRMATIVIAFNRKWSVHSIGPADLQRKLLTDLEMPLNGVLFVPESLGPWRKKLRAIPGSLIYDRETFARSQK